MSMEENHQNTLTSRTLMVNVTQQDPVQLARVAKALSSLQRVRILEYLADKVANVSEIAQALDMPLATANLHLNSLEEAGLIRSERVAARRGQQKMCARLYDIVVIHFPKPQEHPRRQRFTVEMPVGAFVDHQVSPTCGIVTAQGLVGNLDDPLVFYEPERFDAQLIWFSHGYLEYRFPYRARPEQVPHRLQISMELCSEAAPHRRDWPSDIFLEINGVLVGTWTSPGDFGGERGRLTPEWWEDHNSQYGLLKTWRVDEEGSYIDGRYLSSVTIRDLKLGEQPFIRVRIGVKPDAANVGGMNLFGRQFGNYPQDIVLDLDFE
ncbi:helix-turn-helix domain-containing protein [Litorilinea aerophila]|nr:helix-turn-helix domain-containing protein [Litorilinea aerophila]MCC9078747.1 helix-turn-helix domain-containing protein [Litorilinea aerophila]GIV78791.1 MAG: transcriptional regulator [Litorilinea sp.]